MLGPSEGKGIGVFAAHDIPEGTPMFIEERIRKRRREEIPPEFLKYCCAESDEIWLAPEHFGRMGIPWYLNHSDSPQLKWLKQSHWVVIRSIRKGDEVTVDYNDFDEPEHLKEGFYRRLDG